MIAHAIVLSLSLVSPQPDPSPKVMDTANFVKKIGHMSTARATTLARHINRVAAKVGIDPKTFALMLAQESSFKTKAVACWKRKDKTTTCDLGIAQINWDTWGKRFKLSLDRLLSDDGYSIAVAGRILSIMRRGHEDNPYWWARYNNPANVKVQQKYIKAVLRRAPPEYWTPAAEAVVANAA